MHSWHLSNTIQKKNWSSNTHSHNAFTTHLYLSKSPLSIHLHLMVFVMLRFNFPYNFIIQVVKWDLFVACHITKHISIQTYFLVYRFVRYCVMCNIFKGDGERFAPFRIFFPVVLTKCDYLYLLARESKNDKLIDTMLQHMYVQCFRSSTLSLSLSLFFSSFFFFYCFVLHLFATLLSCFPFALYSQQNRIIFTCIVTLTMIYEFDCAIFMSWTLFSSHFPLTTHWIRIFFCSKNLVFILWIFH